MGPDQQRLSPAERENLTAYLDGELGEAEAAALSAKLTHSATARREVEILQKTWELLDHLPRPRASDHFTERTLSEVRRLDARGGELESALTRGFARTTRSLFWVLGSCAAFLLGFALTRWGWPDPTARLARDLSIAENLDAYRDVGSFEFLQQLVNSPEFASERGN